MAGTWRARRSLMGRSTSSPCLRPGYREGVEEEPARRRLWNLCRHHGSLYLPLGKRDHVGSVKWQGDKLEQAASGLLAVDNPGRRDAAFSRGRRGLQLRFLAGDLDRFHSRGSKVNSLGSGVRAVAHLPEVAFSDVPVDEANDEAHHAQEESHHEENAPGESRRRTGVDTLSSHGPLRPCDGRGKGEDQPGQEGEIGIFHSLKV